MEKHRLAVNAWIRTRAKFDAVINLDPLMKGGPVYAGSESLKPEFNCGDYTAPRTRRATKAMGEAIDLRLFMNTTRWHAVVSTINVSIDNR